MGPRLRERKRDRMTLRVALIASLGTCGFAIAAAQAEPQRFCVKCVDPNQTYICEVETNQPVARSDGLQLYCIVQTSKEGGHRSCAVDKTPVTNCNGVVKSYAFAAPYVPPDTQATIEENRQNYTSDPAAAQPPASQEDKPSTLVGASKKGIQSTGQAMGGAARGVGKAAGKVGSATKKTGSAVGSATRRAYDCVKSFFRECGSSDEPQ